MKKIQIVLMVLTLLVLGLAIYGGYKLYKKANSTLAAANQATFSLRQQVVAEVTTVVRGELGVLYPHVDSVIKASGLKVKKINEVTNIYHKTIYDTIGSIFIPDSAGLDKLNFSFAKDCFMADGLIDFAESSMQPSVEDADKIKLYLTDVQMTDTTTTLYYYERETKKIWFLRLRIGRKHYFSESYSSCEGQTKTETIKLIKR
jgi:hypothetical protein